MGDTRAGREACLCPGPLWEGAAPGAAVELEEFLALLHQMPEVASGPCEGSSFQEVRRVSPFATNPTRPLSDAVGAVLCNPESATATATSRRWRAGQ